MKAEILKCKQDHQDAEYICTFKSCDQSTRKVCQQCVSHHNHQKNLSQTHIVNKKDFIEKMASKVSSSSQNTEIYQIIMSKAKKLIELVQQCLNTLSSLVDQMENDYQEQTTFNFYLSKKMNEKYWQIQDDEIKKIMEIDQNMYQKYLAEFQIASTQILKVCQKFSSLFNEQCNNEFQQLKQEKYKNSILFQVQFTINIAQISHNEEYLVYGGDNQEFIIKNLKQNKDYLSIKLNSFLKTCKFSQNDRYLHCGEISGNLSVYDFEQGMKQIYSKKIHNQAINNIIVNQFHIISCSDDLSIIITDIKNKKCILQVQNAHQNSIYGLDYDQQQELIVSSSKDLSIKFFNYQNGELLINNQMSHDNFIMQIQFIKYKRLISASYDDLKIWQINLALAQIIILQSLTQKNIYNFSSIRNDSLIIVVSQNFLNIYDESLGLVSNFFHNKDQNKFLTYYQTNQLPSMKYIIIKGQNYYQLLSQGDKQ